MAQPSSRDGLIDYAKRQLGFPVLEINVADEQFSDLLDDAVQVYQERHYDGIMRMYLKYEITQDDVNKLNDAISEAAKKIVANNESKTFNVLTGEFE